MAIHERDHVGLVVYDVDRLKHAVVADPSKPFTGGHFEKRARAEGAKIVKEWDEWVEDATLPPKVLRKLKAKVLFSLRGEMDMLGELELADHVIFTYEGEK